MIRTHQSSDLSGGNTLTIQVSARIAIGAAHFHNKFRNLMGLFSVRGQGPTFPMLSAFQKDV